MFCSQSNPRKGDIRITGVGVTTAVGQGKHEFRDAILAGRHAFGVMKRPGRGVPTRTAEADPFTESPAFLGAEMGELILPSRLKKKSTHRLALGTGGIDYARGG